MSDEHSFDETYKKSEHMFGEPYKELREYFKKYEPKGLLLDVGAGQGRDALYLSAIGYEVAAVDNSDVGIVQMLAEAKKQGLEVHGTVADAMNVKIEKKYGIILFDMILHAFEKEEQKKLLRKYAECVSDKGLMCMIFPDDVARKHIVPTLNTVGTWKVRDEIVIRDIPQVGEEAVDFTFVMVCVERVRV